MSRTISRRTALGFIGAGGATVALASCGLGMKGSTTPVRTDVGGTMGQPLVSPSTLRSSNGLLEVALTASSVMLPWGSGERYALAYNGSVPGPTLRVRPGDTLRVTLKNDLDRTTNLHTHGLHVSPEGNGDNVYVMVDRGRSFTYEYRIPSDHPSGTFWYHPHHHGYVAEQVFGGMAGAILIDDAIDAMPEMLVADEHVLVLSDPRIGATSKVLDATTADKQAGREGDAILVNGQLRPTISAAVGSTQHWRIINASASRYYRLSVDLPDLYLIGTDQGRLRSPERVTEVTLTPGQRVEVLVPLTRVGRAVLSTTEVERGKNMSMGMGNMSGMGAGSTGQSIGPVTPLLDVDVSAGDGAASTVPMTLRASMPEVPSVVARRRSISFGAMSMGNGEFVIDGQPFSESRITAAPVLGTTEEWVITNNSMMDHPFHLHVWPFRVVSRSSGRPPESGWHDTVNIPVGESVTIRVPFEDLGGKTVFHCHILDHEDLGMMANVEVR